VTLKYLTGVGADERDVEIARRRSVGVERRSVAPAIARHRAATQDDGCARGNHLVDLAAERVERSPVAAEREADDVVALLLLGQTALLCIVRNRIEHAETVYKSAAGWRRGGPARRPRGVSVLPGCLADR